MTVCVCFPTCNVARATTARDQWRGQGYSVAVWVEAEFPAFEADLLVRAPRYPGYWGAVNHLARTAVRQGADIVILAGDDMDPHEGMSAEEIAAQYREHFPDLCGVMQPIGDRDRVPGTSHLCGSPWLGKGWVERAYRGSGPTWIEYGHFFGDEELKAVARKLHRHWPREDLRHRHHHWCAKVDPTPIQPYQKANSDRWWDHDQAIFNRRKAAEFPCSDLLELA